MNFLFRKMLFKQFESIFKKKACFQKRIFMQNRHNIMKNHLEDIITDAAKYLDKTNDKYRRYDPGLYLYKKTMKYEFESKFHEEFIELSYVTLAAWGMASRGASLKEFDSFKKSITDYQSVFNKLGNYRIENISNAFSLLHELYNKLEISNTNTKIVAFSKLMHFFLPNLVAPIDRRYTLNFFYYGIDEWMDNFYGKNNKSVYISKNEDRQWERFVEIEKYFSEFTARNINILEKNINKNNWNQNIPKILDNLIIGRILTHKDEFDVQSSTER